MYTCRGYFQLLDEIHQLTLIPKSLLCPELTQLSVRSVRFSMYTVVDQDQDYLVIHCELGALPTEQREQVLIRLLETNFHLVNSAKPVTFCHNENTGHIMLSMAQPLSRLTAQGVLDQLGALADYALVWRENYFLGTSYIDQLTGARPVRQSSSETPRGAI